MRMESICCTETLVNNYQPVVRNMAEKRYVKGVVLVDICICGEYLSAGYYCGTLKSLLLINSKLNLALLQRSVIILHDDTRTIPLSNFKLLVPIKK